MEEQIHTPVACITTSSVITQENVPNLVFIAPTDIREMSKPVSTHKESHLFYVVDKNNFYKFPRDTSSSHSTSTWTQTQSYTPQTTSCKWHMQSYLWYKRFDFKYRYILRGHLYKPTCKHSFLGQFFGAHFNLSVNITGICTQYTSTCNLP